MSQKENEKIFKDFSSLGEGGKQAKYIINNLLKQHDAKNIVRFVMQSFAKVCGYLLGKHYKWLPNSVCKKCCMNKKYFSNN